MIQGETYTVYIGNNLDILPTLQDCSVDSIVTDPPYELGFMGKKWDNTGIAYNTDLWRECLRVLKPGGHLLSFGGTRTWHRVAVAIEDAGFEVRDSIAWMYGSGFPKSLDVSKAIDKAAGAEREKIRIDASEVRNPKATGGGRDGTEGATRPWIEKARELGYHEKDSDTPATLEAQQWEGWGTALKPAFEPIVVARKPLIGTVAENVLTHGTGALNIDGSRIGTEQITINNYPVGFDPKNNLNGLTQAGQDYESKTSQGRWPANVILDEYSAEILDEQSGIRPSGSGNKNGSNRDGIFGKLGKGNGLGIGGDTGGASRFFYVAKASKRDRNEGLDDLPTVRASAMGYDIGLGEAGEGMFKDRNPQKQNFHPTVKPTDLMRYLIKLVTPPNGIVLDPFTGSGSTGKAAILEGFRFIGIEMTEDYIPIIEGRLKHAEDQRNEGLF
jgi:site-specific DNA-methyltransferase (adenine-specific)